MKFLKAISIICSIIGFLAAGFGLFMGVNSIGATDLNGIGVIFIMPSIIAFLIVLADFLIVIDKVRPAIAYCVVSNLVKLGIIIQFIPMTLYNYSYEKQFGVSNLKFDLTCITLLAIITIPSIYNTIKYFALKKQEN